MSFFDFFSSLDQKEIVDRVYAKYDQTYLLTLINKESLHYYDFLALLSPSAESVLNEMAIKSQFITKKFFGNTMLLYVPLYLSNECSNACLYCGFNKNANIIRRTLSLKEIEQEILFLKEKGFDHILLLTGEYPSVAGIDYLEEAISLTKKYFSSISLEVFPSTEAKYKQLVDAGATGLTLYQETYHLPTYKLVHLSGPKTNFAFRLNAPEEALAAGFRKVGLGALLGLTDWRFDSAFVGSHAKYLMNKFWKSDVSISFPRLRHTPSSLPLIFTVSDKNLVQMILAFRLFLPSSALTLSTRESAELRDNLMGLCITQMSAESKTNPGGYTSNLSTEQFSTDDNRSLKKIISCLNKKGLDPILKDWSNHFQGFNQEPA
ncbi:MAG: thiamine biosynthesis protein ThiH [Candidatus Margulisbacteria bacterium GWF2_35_9]|nr:MAG: thiamine biosynthesis protein ThiH [Candidatus Margulisbacteria bacterium GWF2_35_9]